MPVRMCLARLPDGRGCPNRIQVERYEKRVYCPEHHHLERQHQSSGHQRARREAMERADGRCESCGTPYGPLHLHHIDGNPANNDPANCRILCRDCHTEAGRALKRA
jgi:5-methylcytosine-specific restriction endonuclease McrA